MRKLFIGIAAVALLSLLAAPTMASLATADVEVEITVDAYGAIEFSPALLAFNVEGPYEPGVPYGASIDFTVLCNLNTNLVLTVPEGETSEATAAPGTGYYPTAYKGSDRIGFGVALTNLTTSAYGPWNELMDGNATVFFGASMRIPVETFPNARITVNSYMDSARDDKALASPGLYEQTLTLTLSAAS